MLEKERWKGECANIVIVSLFVHHYGACAPSLVSQEGNASSCALRACFQRVAIGFLLVKLCNNCLPRMDLQQKQCTKCGVVKPLDEFYKNVKGKYGANSYCKLCDDLKTRQYKINNPVMRKTGQMLAHARKRAKAKHVPFDIDIEYVRSLVVSHCPVYGMPLNWSTFCENKPIPTANSPSLDRIDPTKGYVKGNVWIISHKANTFKSYATHEELKILVEAVGRALVNSLSW